MDSRPPAPDPHSLCLFRLPVGPSGYCELVVPLALAGCIGPFARLSEFRRDGALLDMALMVDGRIGE